MAAIPYEVITWEILPYLDVDERVQFNQLLEPKDRFYKRMRKEDMETHDEKVAREEWLSILLGVPGKGCKGLSRMYSFMMKPRMEKVMKDDRFPLDMHINDAMDILSHDEEWFEGRPERQEFQKIGAKFLEMYAP